MARHSILSSTLWNDPSSHNAGKRFPNQEIKASIDIRVMHRAVETCIAFASRERSRKSLNFSIRFVLKR